jgi:putative spermidine/putrescine transport system permease protein
MALSTPVVRTSWSRRLSERGLDRLSWLMVPGLVFIALLFVYPCIYGILLSFQTTKGVPTLGNYARFFTDPYLRDTIQNTFRIALPASLFNVVVSVPLALGMLRRPKASRWVNTLIIIPITLGTVLVAEGLLNYLGPLGWLNRVLMSTGLLTQPLDILHTYKAVIVSLIITGFPFSYLLVLSYMSGINPKLGEAARMLGASSAQRFWHVTLPLLAPGLAITFCLAFVLSFSVFPSANLLGNPSGDSHVLSVAAAQAAFEQYNYPLASTISVITAIVELLVIGVVLAWRNRLYRGSTAGNKG